MRRAVDSAKRPDVKTALASILPVSGAGSANRIRTFRRALATLPRRMASAETGFDRSKAP